MFLRLKRVWPLIGNTVQNQKGIPLCLPFPQVLDPEKQADMLDSLRIYLLQYATLLVEHAPHHIHDNNKNRNSKLRRLMTFAWPCLLSKACVDPACKYSGHLLLAHIIAKFAIHKKIVLQVLCEAASCLTNSWMHFHPCTRCSCAMWPLLFCSFLPMPFGNARLCHLLKLWNLSFLPSYCSAWVPLQPCF